jgi:glycosyltransferase involved in cell wall biosynthesis
MRAASPSLPVVLESRVVNRTGGGPDKTILNSPRFLTASGYRTLCAFMHPPGDAGFEHLCAKAATWGAPIVSIPDHGPWDLGVVIRFLRVCRRERVAIWHGHDYKSNLLGLILKRFWSMKLLTTVHGWVKETPRTPLYYSIDRRCLKYYDQVIAVSPDLFAECRAWGVRPERCALIENAIDQLEFSPCARIADAKGRLGVPPSRLLIGSVGRLSDEKNFPCLIAAVDRLLGAGVDVELIICGEGEREGELNALIGKLGREDRIRLLGYKEDPRPFYEALDVFALSSVREGLPNVLLEAMSMGVPVVSTRVAGIPRLIQNDANGLLVDADSVDELTQALTRLSADPELRQHLRRAGRETIESRYGFEERMRKIKEVYDRLLAS